MNKLLLPAQRRHIQRIAVTLNADEFQDCLWEQTLDEPGSDLEVLTLIVDAGDIEGANAFDVEKWTIEGDWTTSLWRMSGFGKFRIEKDYSLKYSWRHQDVRRASKIVNEHRQRCMIADDDSVSYPDSEFTYTDIESSISSCDERSLPSDADTPSTWSTPSYASNTDPAGLPLWKATKATCGVSLPICGILQPELA